MIFLKSKNGNAIVDSIIVIVVIFAFSLFIIVGKNMFDDINTDIQDSDDLSTQAKQVSSDLNNRYDTFFDNLFLFGLIVLWMVIIVLSLVTEINPMFFVFALLILVAVLYVGMELANTYEDFTSDGEYSSIASNYPKMNWIFEHFLQIVLAMVLTVTGALFGKSQLL